MRSYCYCVPKKKYPRLIIDHSVLTNRETKKIMIARTSNPPHPINANYSK